MNLRKFNFKKNKKSNNKPKKIFKLFKKYNYDINRVVGVKEQNRYILFTEKKLLRIYRDKLKSTPLLCSYVPIENAIFYSFKVEKNVIGNVDLDSFVETKVYDEAGLLETEQYIIKYEVITELRDNKKAIIQCVIVPVSFINEHYQYVLKETGYIDYLSFPAFAYKSLYEEDILKKGNDLFVVILYDKIFFTFYSAGELVYINTVTGGLNRLFESLKEINIADFNEDLFKKLLTKKGIDDNKYLSSERIVLDNIKDGFKNYSEIIEGQILELVNNYEIDDIDRIFIITEYGDIPGIIDFYEDQLQKRVLGFEFYEEYNLDKLPIDPFLFLGMLETHYAYKNNNLKYNFSLFLRKPTFFYRPSGILILTFIVTLILFSIYPLYLYFDGLSYESKIKKIQKEVNILNAKREKLLKISNNLKDKLHQLKENITSISKKIEKDKKFIKSLYEFKYGYLPKSKELVDITALMNKNNIYLVSMQYENGIYTLDVYSYKDKNLGKFVDDLINNGFSAYFDNIEKKNGKYYTTIRIKE